VAAVTSVRPRVDTVVVNLHYGSDLTACPTTIQRRLVDDLAAAGADVIVGQHAHIVLGGGYHGSAYVDYGLGNFEFYVSGRGVTAETGVLSLTVNGRSVSNPTWFPGQIVGGLPHPLSGAAAAAASKRWEALRECTGLTATPS
jgi:poly-gamma-glutamate capsule biosynthesis protein CapA/YwtB (metallophosphatase superfamily)